MIKPEIQCPKSRRRPNNQATSKDGYKFDPNDDYWRLNKDIYVAVALPTKITPETVTGFRATLLRYAEESSAHHTRNMEAHFRRFLKETDALQVTTSALINWRAILGTENEYQLGALRGFFVAWHDYGFEGISNKVVDLLDSWSFKGNEKGAAVLSGCPETGPFTDLEIGSLLEWANMAVAQKAIAYEDYAYLLTLVMTARRPVQIAALRGRDLVREAGVTGPIFRLNIPRAKQQGRGFRSTFRSLAILEDLYLVLCEQHTRSIAEATTAIGREIEPELSAEIPIFINKNSLTNVKDPGSLRDMLLGDTPDKLHAITKTLNFALNRCAAASTARSERTGEFIRLAATRFRRTRGTNLRREGFGPFIIAELLDHSTTQSVSVYTENTAQEAVVIDQLVGAKLAPFAQACLGRLVNSEREAIRGGEPRSRIANQRQNAVGTCGNFGFCASGFKACYTCFHFQPWVNGPHEEVLVDLYAEKARTREAGCADSVVNANDQLILAVEHCVAMCNEEKARIPNTTSVIAVSHHG